MAAGSWKDWAQGELVTESGFQDIQDSIVFIYGNDSAANSALTNKVEGSIYYNTTDNVLKAWDGSAWNSVSPSYFEAHNRWYISADITGTNAVISSNWVKSTSANDTFSGGDMSESSGVFTFPATGYWLIRMEAQIEFGAGDTTFTICNFSNNNFTSSSTLIQITAEGVANTEFFQTANRVFKVTDTANDKVNFELQSYGGSTTLDCGGDANTNFQFTKLRNL